MTTQPDDSKSLQFPEWLVNYLILNGKNLSFWFLETNVSKKPTHYAMFLGNCKGCIWVWRKNVGKNKYCAFSRVTANNLLVTEKTADGGAMKHRLEK
jgi:hypothetical protein